jgi:hypothetical protein
MPNDTALILPFGDSGACTGFLGSRKDLQPGEIMLQSAGGASIKLCANGDVIINGKVF